MNVLDELAKGHSRAVADRVLNYVLADEARVPALIAAFQHEEVKLVQRAAMVVGDLGRARPDYLFPYQALLVRMAADPVHDAVRRNLLRYFSELPLEDVRSEDVAGHLLELAFNVTEDPLQPTGIRVFAMQIVANFCVRYPELKDELRAAIEGELKEASPGFRSRGKKILAQLK